MKHLRNSTLSLLFALSLTSSQAAGERDTQVREDRSTFSEDESWIYNDLEAATAQAKASGKPMFIVLRCIP